MEIDEFTELIDRIENFLYPVKFGVAIPGILINILQLSILCQKSMRGCSASCILIGIAFNDLIRLSVIVRDKISQLWFPPFICEKTSGDELWIRELQRDILEQTSVWLGVYLALLRLLILKKSRPNQWISKPACGYCIVLFVYSISITLSSLFYFKVNLVFFNNLSKKTKCPVVTERLLEKLDTMELFSGGSQMLIILIYPVLAVSLIYLIKNSTSDLVLKRRYSERIRAAKMILIMTIFYFICCAPYGILDFVILLTPENQYLWVLIDKGGVFTTILFCLNSISHCFLNFSMSSRYRETAKQFDLIRLSVIVIDKIKPIWFPPFICEKTSGDELWIRELQRDILEQTSVWLGVYLALLRLLILKKSRPNQWISKPACGYCIVLFVYSISITLSSLFYFKVNFSFFIFEELEIMELVSGGTQLLIILIHPVLAISLIYLIRKSAKELIQKNLRLKRLHIAKMISIMTIFYFIYCAPYGIMDFLTLIFPDNQYLWVLVDKGEVFTTILFCLNSIFHGFLNFSMSSKYRETGKKLYGFRKFRKVVSHTVT
ncbi:Protein CBG10513 [Caenorhabditis briggsae]|uniref:Protein CBG10513 n=1 Tax=Caenorhabditis briggsae TaxID=6238 RepID=A8XAZ4_CAEBR|nr:Protein CBG10513 [Caenorhabditis briggsae]CAP29922.2 Protein CBG10513 [Caenorhabditis briggsae]